MPASFTIGLDFGTNSCRALIVNTANGKEIATAVWNYKHGEAGVVISPRDPNLARQHPEDYLNGAEAVVKVALRKAKSLRGFSPDRVIGLGVDTTGSTPIPVDKNGSPLALQPKFKNDPAAMAWLWKDHTGHAEAAKITEIAARLRPQFLAKCGGIYSSEWFWSKIWRCLAVSPKVFNAAYSWVEMADWIPAFLTGTEHPQRLRRCVCAAGHKAMFNPGWGGYPDAEFIAALDPKLVRVQQSLPDRAYSIADKAGDLTPVWARKLGLPAGIPVAIGAFDAHLGGVGCGIQPGALVRIVGTSTCDMMVAPMSQDLPDIPGLCGIVPESILPGMFGLEAGQSAVGDIFNWFVNCMKPANKTHEALTREADKLKPGASGLLALDWHNGNRTVLVDQRLTGGMIGMTLHTTPAEVYRALIEATGFGARVIMERFEEYGVKVSRVVNCGGISVKNPMAMQIYADIMGRTMEVSASDQTCALGAAIAGAVVAGVAAGGHADYAAATKAMTAIRPKKYKPDAKRAAVYNRLFALYRRLHDALGVKGHADALADVMKALLAIRDEARG
jgi:L-ribulokinase